MDYGQRHLGLAVSDPAGSVALPLSTVTRGPGIDSLGKVATIAAEQGAELVVVGLPVRLDRSEGQAARAARRFARRLQERLGSIPVHLQEERLTTAESNSALRDRPRKQRQAAGHENAAVIILQAYLASKTIRVKRSHQRCDC